MLAELTQKYKVAKQNFEKAKKEEEKLKKELKDLMKKEGKPTLTDEEGYTFVRGVQERKKLDEDKLIGILKEKGLNDCIKTVEAVDEDATLKAVQEERLEQEKLTECLEVKEVVTLTMKAPKKS